MTENVVLVPRPFRRRYRADVATAALMILDDEGEALHFDAEEAANLFALTGDLDAATVSACPQCRSRILAVVALADLLDDAPLFVRAGELIALADDAPTLHVYVRDLVAQCTHRDWLDPGFEEWSDVMADLVAEGRPAVR